MRKAISDHIRTEAYSVDRIGIEAGTMSQALFYGLIAEDFGLVCVESRHVSAAMSDKRDKTDEADARASTPILHAGRYKPVDMKSR